jgi:hypothetical protein
VPPIQEDTVLYVLRVRVPEKLSLQQLEQLRKNWAHEVRKEISAERTHQDTFVVQSYPPKYATIYRVGQDTFRVQYYGRRDPVILGKDTAGAGVDRTRYTGGYFLYAWEPIINVGRVWGIEQDTAGAGVDRTRYTGGYFLYRMGQDTFAVQYFPPKEFVGYYLDGTPQDTAGAGMAKWYGRYVAFLFGMGQDTFGVQYRPKPGGYYLFGTPQDTAGAGADRTRYTGGYFLYALPQDTTKPAQLVDYGTPQGTTEPASAARINIKPLADRVIVEPAPAEDRRGPILVMGQFIPTHVGLPMPELELDPGDGPVCGIPGPLGQGEETIGSTARYTGYVLNQAIASGAGRPTGKTLGAVTRQAPPQGGNQNMGQAIRQQLAELGAEVEIHRMAGPISLPRPSDVGIPEFRMMPLGGGAPVLWPNGNPPSNPDWPWVGVIGTPVLEGIDGAPGPGKPQNWCGTEYIWTGPRPKSPKELILTPVIPRPR